MDGYVKLYRQTIRSPIFADAEMWKLATWCLCKATRFTRPQPIDCGPIKKSVQLYPGDFVTGRNRGAEELGWNPSTFRNRLYRLEHEYGFITTRQDKHFTVVSICNWEAYQGDEPDNRTNEGPTKDSPRTNEGPTKDTNKNGRMQEPKKETTNSCKRFEEFWQAYPTKKGKKPCKEIWRRKKLDSMADTLIQDVQNRQQQDKKWKDGFIPNPQTYLNQERWEDEVEQADENKPSQYQQELEDRINYG